jgi:hypothetical protein
MVDDILMSHNKVKVGTHCNCTKYRLRWASVYWVQCVPHALYLRYLCCLC